MEKMMRAMGQAVPTQKRILELNPNNEIIKKLNENYNFSFSSFSFNAVF